MSNIERIIVIIDHVTHDCYIECLTKKDLERYDNSEQKYINDNYVFDGDYSWDWVTSIQGIDDISMEDITGSIIDIIKPQ